MGNVFTEDEDDDKTGRMLTDREIKQLLGRINEFVSGTCDPDWMVKRRQVERLANPEERRALLEFSTWFVGL